MISLVCICLLCSPIMVSAANKTNTTKATTIKAVSSKKLNGVITQKGKKYYYKNGVKQKNCWDKNKKYYFGKNGVAYAAPKAYGCKKNIVVKKIGKYQYGFDVNGRKVTNGVYADSKGKAYYFNKSGTLNTSKTNKINKAAKYMASGKNLRKLLGKELKSKYSSSCMNGVYKDVQLTYPNIYVELGRYKSGKEIVYGIQAR